MTNISGKYNFQTRVGNTPECVFLYKKLQDTTRAFNYQTDIKTYQLSDIVGGVNDGRPHWAVIELPDNTGDYDSVSDAKNRKRTAKKKDAPCVSNDRGDTEPGADGRQIIVLWVIRDASLVEPEFIIAGNCAGYQGATSGAPGGETDADYIGFGAVRIIKAPYIFFNEPYSFQQDKCRGSKPYMDSDTAVFCQNKPFGVEGKVAYRLNVIWNKSAYRPARTSTGNDGVFYDGNKPSSWSGTGEEFLEVCDDNTYTALIVSEWENVGGTTADLQSLNSCGSDDLDGWWLYDARRAPGQVIGYTGNSISSLEQDYSYICWQGSQSQYGAWEAYMNEMLTFWGVLSNGAVLTRIGSMVNNTIGGFCGGDPGDGYPPDPTPPITPLIGTATYHGRYCDIFVNYQKNGIVRELKLPIDFPTRVTHVSYEHNNFYNINYPRESPGQRFENPYFAEWFSGRVNIDKNNIYVDIIYGIYREYEDGKKIFPNGTSASGSADGQYNTHPERPGIINRWNEPTQSDTGIQPNGSLDDYQPCIIAQNTEQVFARPTRDKFNKTVRYTIDKNSFSIINTQTFIGNHQETENLFTDNFLKKNTILDISGLAGYRRYNSSGSMPNNEPPSPITLNPSVNHQGFVGLPKPYFQVSCRPDNVEVTNQWIERPFELNPLLSDYSCYVANDFLTLKTDWDDIYWLFYLMMEQPFIDRTKPITPIQFKQRCQLKGAGYRANTNKYYLSFRESRANTLGVAPGFFDLYIEHERMRGYPVIKDDKIVRWLRISPDSFPLFEPGAI